MRLLRRYFAQSYVFFLRRNSADLAKNILSEVNQRPAPLLTLATTRRAWWRSRSSPCWWFSTLGRLVRHRRPRWCLRSDLSVHAPLLRSLGKEQPRTAPGTGGFEAFGAIKDIKLLGKEDVLVAQFTGPSRRFNNCQATAALIGNMPRHLFDVLPSAASW